MPENIEKGTRPSYALVKAGWWGKDAAQLHNFYGIDEFSGDPARLNVRMGECSLSETRMIGTCAVTDAEAREHPEYMCGAGSMSWDLSIDKKIPFNVGYGASPFVRSLNAFEMFWHAEGIKTEYSGTVVLNGGTYRIEPQTSFGYADKNWGADFTSPWLWISSCDLVSLQSGKRLDNSAVEIGGGNPKVYGFSLGRKLLGSLVYQGVEYEFNFSRFWTGSSVRFSFTEGEKDNVWTVRAKS